AHPGPPLARRAPAGPVRRHRADLRRGPRRADGRRRGRGPASRGARRAGPGRAPRGDGALERRRLRAARHGHLPGVRPAPRGRPDRPARLTDPPGRPTTLKRNEGDTRLAHDTPGPTAVTDRDGGEEAAPAPFNRNVVLAVLVSGAFVMILNQTLLNTALPAFMKDFGITASSAQWLTTIFMLVNGIMIPVTAFLINKFTTRGLFFTAMGLFIAGTLVCAVSPTYPVLVIGRIIQASGAGIIIPLMQTILFAIFPLGKRGTAMGTFGLVIAFAPAI